MPLVSQRSAGRCHPGRDSEALRSPGWQELVCAALATGLSTAIALPVPAQTITPAPDGTNTLVTPNGTGYDISGGTLSGDRTNLFHSFSQFGLTPGQIATFLANPQLRNILGRVTGNTPSVIDGVIRISGGSPNLYLINPAGILFGATAQLNVPASFTATTATAIGFNCGLGGVGCNWFSATDPTNYAVLNGVPNGFAMTGTTPGAIANAGNLSVNPGQSLALLGGVVVNTGQLTAPDGQVAIAAVPGQTFVRWSQAGNPLSLEFQPLTANFANPATPPTLAQLLTGGNLGNATGLTVDAGGTVRLVGSGVPLPQTAGTAIAAGTLSTTGQTGGAIGIFGQQVGLVGASLNASGLTGGGSVWIGGDYQGQGTLPTATNTTISADSQITADALQTGNGGRVIVWADQTTRFAGAIAARGGALSGDGGFVEVSGKENLVFRGAVDVTAANGLTGTLLLDPTNITIVNGAGAANDGELTTDGQILFGDGGAASFTISEQALETLVGFTTLTLQATNTITIQDLADNALSFAGGFGGAGGIFFQAGTAIAMLDPNDAIVVPGGNLTMTAGSLSLGAINTSSQTVNGGNITLTATNGSITAGNLISNSVGQAGAIAVTSNTGSITVGQISASATTALTPPGLFGDGNTVTLQTLSNGGDITFSSIDTRGVSNAVTAVIPADGGAVTIAARGTVRGTGTLPGGSTIISSGDNGGTNGTVQIQHDGGVTNQPFVVGGGAGVTNGTAGAIVSSATDTILAGTFPFATSPATTPTNGIRLTFLNDTPTISTVSALPTTTVNQAVTVSTADLALATADLNADNVVVRVAAIAPGAVLRVNGADAGVGTIIPFGASLQYIPPAGFVGTLANAFSLTVDDVISTSAPRAIALTVQPLRIDPSPSPSPEPSPTPTIPNPCILGAICVQNPVIPPTVLEQTEILVPQLPEERFTTSYANHLGAAAPPTATIDNLRVILTQIEKETGAKPAFVYVSFVPPSLKPAQVAGLVAGAEKTAIAEKPDDQLEVVVVTAKGIARRYRIPSATRDVVLKLANEFRLEVADPRRTRSTTYLRMAQQFYRWFVEPIQAELKLQEINNLVFLLDAGLRSLPVAALHNGQQYLVEQYSIGVMPSVSLSDTRYEDIRASQLLSLGITEATQGQTPLPSVQIEVATLVNDLWSGRAYLNENATLSTLKSARQERPYGIIHLATHADFLPGRLDQSFIQLWEDRLRLNQVRNLGWNDPQVQLLVLSACSTALGDREAELGFGGLAVQAGVKSAVASLWSVNDVATAALITRFYKELQTAPIKAEALRSAQLAMIRGTVFVQGGKIIGVNPQGLPLPAATSLREGKLTHPYYWSAFTMIGSPW